jgi:mannitol-1-/sugar-/sorbitol-6-/2-deoxyglucose-6-phosphatase
MDVPLGAVILDMDGILIDSEHLWRKAMISGFGEWGIHITEDECRLTMGLRISEVVRLWLEKFAVMADALLVEKRIVDLLLELIEAEGVAIPGAMEIIELCSQRNIKTGLATSSPERLMNAILARLQLTHRLDAVVSAEHLQYAKPHPEVFLKCASKLGIVPESCLVIEDSLNGVIAGKAARMKVVAVPDSWHTKIQQFAVADFRMENMMQAYDLCMKILPGPDHDITRDLKEKH